VGVCRDLSMEWIGAQLFIVFFLWAVFTTACIFGFISAGYDPFLDGVLGFVVGGLLGTLLMLGPMLIITGIFLDIDREVDKTFVVERVRSFEVCGDTQYVVDFPGATDKRNYPATLHIYDGPPKLERSTSVTETETWWYISAADAGERWNLYLPDDFEIETLPIKVTGCDD
jgi:hypothetical protein